MKLPFALVVLATISAGCRPGAATTAAPTPGPQHIESSETLPVAVPDVERHADPFASRIGSTRPRRISPIV